MSGPREGQLALRERLERLPSWVRQGPVTVEHNNEAAYAVANDGSKWVMKEVAVTGPNQFLAEAISYQLASLLKLPVPAAAYGDAGKGLAWFSGRQEYVKHYHPARLAETVRHADFGRIIPLDVWVLNEDRHPGNILLCSGPSSFTPCFIDFGSAIIGYPKDYLSRVNYVPREGQFAPRAVADELLIEGAFETVDAIGQLEEPDIRGIVQESCAIAGFESDAAGLADAVLARRVLLRELSRSFLAKLGVQS